MATTQDNPDQAHANRASAGSAAARGQPMTAAQDHMITDLRQTIAELEQKLDAHIAELHENKERYALVSQAVAEGIYDWDIERNALWVSPRLIEIFGLQGLSTSAADWNARVHPDDFDGYRAALRDCFKGTTARLACEYRIRLTSGGYRWVEDHGLPVRSAAGRAVRLVGAVSDITERKETERALRASEERHALAMQAINEAVYEWDVASGEIYYSPRLHQALGLTPEQLRTRADWISRIHPDDLPVYRTALVAHFKGETPRLECEYRFRHPDGHWHWARQHGVALLDATGRAYRMIGSTGDITAERTLAQELERARLQLHDAIESLSEGFALFDPDDRLIICNSRYARFFYDMAGVEIALGMKFETFMRAGLARGMFPLAAPDPDAWLAALLERRRHSSGIREQLVGGTVWLLVSDQRAKDGSLVSVYTDVTELKRRQQELEQAKDAAEVALERLGATQQQLVAQQKMAALGQLTAGIAHEIKNPLNFVNNFSALSTELVDELRVVLAPEPLSEAVRSEVEDLTELLKGNLEKVVQHGKRADGIVARMLEHSSGGRGERRSVDLNALVDEALNLAYHGARAQDQSFNITLEREFADGIVPIEVNPQDMTRVFLNLFGNGFYAANKLARDDAPPGFQPTLTVSTCDLGDRVGIRVRDNGTGIPANIPDKLFEPFFTTKPTGEGTGLGLSITYDIVTKAHGGTITVDSKVGEYSQFTIRLPRNT
jgi:PAS domain S-box-containing protein